MNDEQNIPAQIMADIRESMYQDMIRQTNAAIRHHAIEYYLFLAASGLNFVFFISESIEIWTGVHFSQLLLICLNLSAACVSGYIAWQVRRRWQLYRFLRANFESIHKNKNPTVHEHLVDQVEAAFKRL